MVHNTNNYETTHSHSHQHNQVTEPNINRTIFTQQPNMLTMKTVNLTYKKPNELSTKKNQIKQVHVRASPIAIHRYRSMVENISPHQNLSSVNDRLDLTFSPYSILQKKSPRDPLSIPKPIKYSTSITEGSIKYHIHNSKLSYSPPTIPTWTPSITEKKEIQSKISRSKTYSLKHPMNHQNNELKREKYNTNSKRNGTPELSITPKPITNPLAFFNQALFKDFIQEPRDDTSMNLATISDDDDSVVTQCDNPLHNTLNMLQKLDSVTLSLSKSSMNPSNNNTELKPTKPMPFWQRSYATPLPPVVENVDDEELC